MSLRAKIIAYLVLIHGVLAAISVFGLAFMGNKIEEARAGREPEPSRALLPGGFVNEVGAVEGTG